MGLVITLFYSYIVIYYCNYSANVLFCIYSHINNLYKCLLIPVMKRFECIFFLG